MESKIKPVTLDRLEKIARITDRDIERLIEKKVASEFSQGKLAVCFATLNAKSKILNLYVFEILKGCFEEPYPSAFAVASELSSHLNTLISGTSVHGSESSAIDEEGDLVPTYRFHIDFGDATVYQNLVFQAVMNIFIYKFLPFIPRS